MAQLIPGLRIPAKPGPSTLPSWEMDEVRTLLVGMLTVQTFIYDPSVNVLIWAIALCSHAACKNFAGLFVARFVLGICEGSITAGFMIGRCFTADVFGFPSLTSNSELHVLHSQ